MGWLCRKNGRRKTDTESRCPEIGGEMEVRKTKIAKGDCIKSDLERVGEEWGNYRQKEWETPDRESSKRKVRGRKTTMEKESMVNSPLTTVMPRK